MEIQEIAHASSIPEQDGGKEKKGFKRLARENTINENRKVQRIEYKHLCDETEYVIKNGMRYVKPYVYRHETSCKQRWLGRTVLDVYSSEFGAYSQEYYIDAITTGRITVNNHKVDCTYCVKNGDRIIHTVHRHEPPVPYEPVEILGSTDQIIAVNKPASLPVHTCGAYRYNTLEMILKKELHLNDTFFIHRLDRVTSGVLLLAKKKEYAASLSAELREGGAHKIYLAIAEGELTTSADIVDIPSVSIVGTSGFCVTASISIVSQKDGVMECHEMDGKNACTYIFPLYYSSKHNCTLVQCMPITGRTHQIRVHLKQLNHPIDDDFNYNEHIHIAKKVFMKWNPTEINTGDESSLTEDELVMKYCRWCQMPKEDMCMDLFKEEQITHTSIHLHAYSYSINGCTFTTPFPKWDIINECDKEELVKVLEINKQTVIIKESETSHS